MVVARIVHLNFQSYHQSQGGRYECRVAVPGNNSERLPVCIGGCHAWCDGCGLLSIIVHVASTVMLWGSLLYKK